jgi:hypothetical protein
MYVVCAPAPPSSSLCEGRENLFFPDLFAESSAQKKYASASAEAFYTTRLMRKKRFRNDMAR